MSRLYFVRQPWHGNPWRTSPGGASETVESLLAEARSLLDLVEAEVRRLSTEVFELRAGNLLAFGPFGPLLDPLGIGQRAAVYEGFIGELERFVRDVFNRVEAKAMAGDIDAARRLRDSTRAILGAAQSSTPVSDLGADAKTTVKTALEELEALVVKIVKAVGIGLAITLAIEVLRMLRR